MLFHDPLQLTNFQAGTGGALISVFLSVTSAISASLG
jgi:hypothetical protein